LISPFSQGQGSSKDSQELKDFKEIRAPWRNLNGSKVNGSSAHRLSVVHVIDRREPTATTPP
jgi:hypothetical protein